VSLRVDKLWNLPFFSSQVHHLLKAKYSTKLKKNLVGKRKVTKETKQPAKNPATTAVATTTARGGHWSAVLPRFLNDAFCALPWIAALALDHSSSAYWACFASSPDLVWPILHDFLLTLGSIYVNQIKTQTRKTQA